MSIYITSPQNDIIKHIKFLHQKNNRDKYGEFFIEGYRFVNDAFQNGTTFKYILVSETADDNVKTLSNNISVPLYIIKESLFKQISDTQNPQGIMAVLEKPKYESVDILKPNEKFIVILDNIQDPGNMGTIIRTAESSGADRIVISKGCVDIYNPKTLRSTMGSIFHRPIITVDNLSDCITILKQNRYKIFAGHLKGETEYFSVDMSDKTAIVIGNEANGISDEVAKMCKLIKIPMYGRAESLNASISAGILMYEYVRQNYIK